MNTIDVLRYGQQTFLAGLDRLPESEWETPGVCGYWSVKQIIAHIASYEAVLADVLANVSGDESTPALDRFLGNNVAFNDDEVTARASLSPSATLDELKAEHDRVMTLIERIPVETLRSTGTIPWYGDEYSIEDLIVYQYYGHKREHVAQIWVFRDHLEG